ncbi:hypothetical protein [Nostoc sp. CENA543]|nr:hypothetical protein [Nostoc sp. CENA543]
MFLRQAIASNLSKVKCLNLNLAVSLSGIVTKPYNVSLKQVFAEL